MDCCPFCGAECVQDSLFCESCGNHLSTGSEKQKKKCAKEPKMIVAGTAIIGSILVLLGIAWALFGAQTGAATEPTKEVNTHNLSDAANAVLFLEVYDDHGNVVSTASGFVIGNGDKIVTNYHVVDNAYRIVAKTANGNASADIRTVISYNKAADLVILKLETDVGVMPLVLGDSDEMKQGDKVFAVGYPLGLSHTMSDGIISSRYEDENGTDMLQITAPISSGNSGGALLNEKGEVVGVVTASYTDGQNLNLAVAGNAIAALLSTKRSYVLEREYISTYTVEYVIANEKELRYKEFLCMDG